MADVRQLTVTIADEWPNLKLLIRDDKGQVVTTDVKQYDVAASNFEVRIYNQFRKVVDEVIKSHKL